MTRSSVFQAPPRPIEPHERALLSVTDALGADRDALAARAEWIKDVDPRVALWEAALRTLADHSLPARVAIAACTEPEDAVGFLCSACADVRSALAALGRYWALAGVPVELCVEARNGRVRLAFFGSAASAGARALIEFSALYAARVLVAAAGPALRPRRFLFAHRGPQTSARHATCANAPFEFDAPVTEVELECDDLEARLPRANKALLRYLEQSSAAELERRTRQPSLSERLVEVLEGELRAGKSVAESAIARRVGMSKSTLHRRLREQGTSFRALRDEVRFRVARVELEKSSIQAVAHQLGFSDARAFHRAFKRWTRATPRGWLSKLKPDVGKNSMPTNKDVALVA